ncbi:alpha/beta hydrolase-fold protein [Aquimarina rubra]|uniref:Alpha/beta hydrolase-fold protein n=1 Tax=Aquimarina rubra TaxID=1920033 RepID=A0ABW5LBP9_9FLAO
MKITKLLILTLVISLNAVLAQENTQHVESSSLVVPQIQLVPIKDTKTEKNYELYIELPENYSENNNKTYPVLYYTDAMWHLEILSASTEYMLEDVILVGISWQKDIAENLKQQYGAHASRFTDYSFWKKANPNHPKLKFGQAENHLRFIRNDVIQYVDNSYRTDPDSRTYFGYSLSGAFGAYILLTQPDTFNNYILGSPLSKGLVPYLSEIDAKLGAFRSNKNKTLNANVFIAYGTLEKEKAEPTNEFINLLNNRTNLNVSIQNKAIKGDHQTAFPMIAIQSVDWLSSLQDKTKTFINSDSLTVEIPYLGQKPPGLVPEPFAPGLVTTKNWQYGGVFTPDLKEFYFIREVGEEEDKKMEFVVFEYKNKSWQERVISKRVGQPFISPDGKIMHLGKRYMERTEDGDWSEIKKLDSVFQKIQIMRLTASSKGTYVFDEIGMPDGDGVIRYSRLIDGKREQPKAFGTAINTGSMNAHPFIAPDESYLIWDGRRDSGYGHSDLYISFKQKDGSWGEAINMGDKINTAAWEAGASVTPDGKYLLFNRNMGSDKYENVDVFWVDAKIIETLRPE